MTSKRVASINHYNNKYYPTLLDWYYETAVLSEVFKHYKVRAEVKNFAKSYARS